MVAGLAISPTQTCVVVLFIPLCDDVLNALVSLIEAVSDQMNTIKKNLTLVSENLVRRCKNTHHCCHYEPLVSFYIVAEPTNRISDNAAMLCAENALRSSAPKERKRTFNIEFMAM